MSFSRHVAYEFFDPLKGKAVTFLIDGRRSNLAFARCVVGLVATVGRPCNVFDVDAFYASNSVLIFNGTAEEASSRVSIHVPEPGSGIESEFPQMVRDPQSFLVVDSLNSLYHLFSFEDGSSRTRKLSFAVASLSYAARTNGTTVVLTMYRRESLSRTGVGRSISSFSDATVSVSAVEGGLEMNCERGAAWPGGKFSIRSPSGWQG